MDQYLSNIYIIYLYIIFHLGSFMGSKLPWFRQVSTPMALPSPFAAVPEAIDVGIEPLGFSGFREQKLRIEAVEVRIEPLKRIEKMWDLARKTEGVNH